MDEPVTTNVHWTVLGVSSSSAGVGKFIPVARHGGPTDEKSKRQPPSARNEPDF